MFNKITKTTILIMFPVASLLALTGCESDEAVAPVAEPVDLTQVEDLFEQPLKPTPPPEPSTVVVRVNGEEITYGEIQNGTAAIIQQELQRIYIQAAKAGQQIPPQQMQQIQQKLQSSPQILEQSQDMLITQKLMDAAVAAANIEVAEEDIAAELEKRRASIPPGQDFETLLGAQGMTVEEFTASMKEQMAIHEFLTSKTEGVEDATEAEAKEYYEANPDHFKRPENVTASHILIKFEEADTDEIKAGKKAKLEKIRTDIIATTISFGDAAKEHSDDPGSAPNGGEYKNIRKGQMVPEFDEATFSQEVDEIGDVIETSFGYHIIKVSEHQKEGIVEFEEAKESIINGLTGQKKQDAVNAFIKSLRDGAKIEKGSAI